MYESPKKIQKFDSSNISEDRGIESNFDDQDRESNASQIGEEILP